jgi:hypothetical protein
MDRQLGTEIQIQALVYYLQVLGRHQKYPVHLLGTDRETFQLRGLLLDPSNRSNLYSLQPDHLGVSTVLRNLERAVLPAALLIPGHILPGERWPGANIAKAFIIYFFFGVSVVILYPIFFLLLY